MESIVLNGALFFHPGSQAFIEAYVNNFRLECFKQKALDPANKNFTLLGLAFESGFNSKSTFNDYFKKKTGSTPRKWLKEHH